jgi:RNA polymerase sigma-70 factor (ECF subfamily)
MGDREEELDQLIQNASAGDRGSLEALLVHFHDPLLGFIQKSVSRGTLQWLTPEDVLQETLIEAFRSARTLEPQGSRAFFSWLKKIARTRLLNMIEAHRAQKRGGERRRVTHLASANSTATSILHHLAGRDPAPSMIVRRKEVVNAIAKALTRLDQVPKEIIEMRFGKGLSIQDIAAKTGKSEGAVKMVINRAIKELREILDDGFGKYSITL